jgi:hypothetical protein
MNHHFASALTFTGTVVAATLAAAVMTGNALAQGPIEGSAPFTSAASRADVRADLMSQGSQVSDARGELAAVQASAPQQMTSGYTRAQARADYIAARDEVRAMTAEDGGSSHIVRASRTADTVVAGSDAR